MQPTEKFALKASTVLIQMQMFFNQMQIVLIKCKWFLIECKSFDANVLIQMKCKCICGAADDMHLNTNAVATFSNAFTFEPKPVCNFPVQYELLCDIQVLFVLKDNIQLLFETYAPDLDYFIQFLHFQ